VLDVGIANVFLLLGFTLFPRLYDVLVGPLFRLLARRRETVGPTPGNVLLPTPDGERLRG
jgi:hypothetical protein